MADNRLYADKQIWELMEEAADTLETASERFYRDQPFPGGDQNGAGYANTDWRPVELRRVAKRWMDEAEAEGKVREALRAVLNNDLPINRHDVAGLIDEILEQFDVTQKPITVTARPGGGLGFEPDGWTPPPASHKLADAAEGPLRRGPRLSDRG